MKKQRIELSIQEKQAIYEACNKAYQPPFSGVNGKVVIALKVVKTYFTKDKVAAIKTGAKADFLYFTLPDLVAVSAVLDYVDQEKGGLCVNAKRALFKIKTAEKQTLYSYATEYLKFPKKVRL